MQQIGLAFMLAVLLSISGCAQMFTAKTSAKYIIHPDGTKEISYESDKEQVGLEAGLDKNGAISVKVDKASTPESVVAATMAVQLQMLKMMESLMSKIPAKP